MRTTFFFEVSHQCGKRGPLEIDYGPPAFRRLLPYVGLIATPLVVYLWTVTPRRRTWPLRFFPAPRFSVLLAICMILPASTSSISVYPSSDEEMGSMMFKGYFFSNGSTTSLCSGRSPVSASPGSLFIVSEDREIQAAALETELARAASRSPENSAPAALSIQHPCTPSPN